MADPKRTTIADPHDEAAEKSVLGAILFDPSLLALVRPIVSASDFYHPAHAVVFEAMVACSLRDEPIDAVTLSAELTARKRYEAAGGMQYLGELAESCFSTVNTETHARLVADRAQRRRVIKAAREVALKASTGAGSWVGDCSSIMSTALDSRHGITPATTLRERAGAVAEKIVERIGKRDMTGLSTGLHALDRMTPGGLLPGQLIVLAGRPGLGKTSLFLQLALFAAAKRRGCSLLFSLEMEVDELVERALCARALVDSARAADGALEEHEANAILSVVGQLEALDVRFDPRSRMRMSDVRARVLAECARGEVAFVGLDYLQLLEQDGDAESREEAISNTTRECKLLAKEAGVPLVLLSQFNRANEKDKRAPKISDLRGSGAIEQDADKVWMIHTEAADEEPEPEVDIIVGKQRKGPKGPARVRFVRSLTVFRDLEGEVY